MTLKKYALSIIFKISLLKIEALEALPTQHQPCGSASSDLIFQAILIMRMWYFLLPYPPCLIMHRQWVQSLSVTTIWNFSSFWSLQHHLQSTFILLAFQGLLLHEFRWFLCNFVQYQDGNTQGPQLHQDSILNQYSCTKQTLSLPVP